MTFEDSAVRRLDTMFPPEEGGSVAHEEEKVFGVQATREELDEIINLYKLYPGLTDAYNFIVKTRNSGAEILSDMNKYTFPDGEGKEELTNLEKRMLNLNKSDEIREHVLRIMGAKVKKPKILFT